MSETKTRTITLTDRRPIKIREEEWPQIASGTGDSYSGSDYSRYQQALGQGECDTYAVRVRQHADGRAIVYAVLDAAASAWGAPAGGESFRGGELLDRGSDLVAAIRRVGETCHLPASVIRECIADLPAEDLTGPGVTDVAFGAAKDVGSIRYRLAPLDVGFDLRSSDTAIQIAAEDDPIRVSYADESGERRVMQGPRDLVLAAMEQIGYRFAIR